LYAEGDGDQYEKHIPSVSTLQPELALPTSGCLSWAAHLPVLRGCRSAVQGIGSAYGKEYLSTSELLELDDPIWQRKLLQFPSPPPTPVISTPPSPPSSPPPPPIPCSGSGVDPACTNCNAICFDITCPGTTTPNCAYAGPCCVDTTIPGSCTNIAVSGPSPSISLFLPKY
jgi:hypothetical protein